MDTDGGARCPGRAARRRWGTGRPRAGCTRPGGARPAAARPRLLRATATRRDRCVAVRASALPALGCQRSCGRDAAARRSLPRRRHPRGARPRARPPRRRDRGPRRRRRALVSGALDDLRVLEIADESGEYAGRLLAGMGAEVVKLEPPAGAPSRGIAPFLADQPHPDRSLHFWHYNVGKRSLGADVRDRGGGALLERLATAFDVIVAAGPAPTLDAIGLAGGAELRRRNPALIVVTITPFGLDGPWRDRPATDLTLMALGGSMAVCGYGPDDPPLACAGWQAYQTACVYAVHGLLGAVLARDRHGRGQDVDVSVHEAAVSITEWHLPQYVFAGQVSPRAVLGQQYRSQDGVWVSTIVPEFFGPHVVPRLLELLAADGLDGPLRDPALAAPEQRRRFHERVGEALAAYCARHPADEIYRAGQRRGFPWAPIRTQDECLDDPHLHDRGFWVSVHHPELGRDFLYAGAPFIAPGCPWRFARRPPLLGEHTAEVLAEAGIDAGEQARLRAAGVIA